MRGALVAAAALGTACIGGVSPARCVLDAQCAQGEACVAAACRAGAREADGGFCPELSPRFSDINANLFQVGCGVHANNCHSSTGSNTASSLDLSGDPYGRLVGAPATDLQGSAADGGTLVRVVPGDPQHSYLVKKLALMTTHDPDFGSGMPPDHPGETCASAQAAVTQWILAGAQRN